MEKKSEQNIVFAIGTGRCGTKFLSKIFEEVPGVASYHELHPLSDTFHRYCKWYDISVDEAGFIATKNRSVEAAKRENKGYFEASGFLSLSVEALYEAFGAKFILLVRRPDKVVLSYLKKGWYDNEIDLDNPSLPPTAQNVARFHHFLGRTIPRGDEFEMWRALSRVGKLAWYWNRLNSEVLRQFDRIPADHWRICRLEDLDYSCWAELASGVGLPATLSRERYESISAERPNAFRDLQDVRSWSDREWMEFEHQVRPMAERMGYVWKGEDIVKSAEEQGSEITIGATSDSRSVMAALTKRFKTWRGK